MSSPRRSRQPSPPSSRQSRQSHRPRSPRGIVNEDLVVPGAFTVNSDGRAATAGKAALTAPPTLSDEFRMHCQQGPDGENIEESAVFGGASGEYSTDALGGNSTVGGGGGSSTFGGTSTVGATAGDATVHTQQEQEQQVEKDKDQSFKKKRMLGIVACVVVIIAVVVGVSVALASGDTDKPGGPSPSLTESPTKAPITSESQRVSSLREAVKHLSSDPSVLEDPLAPQYKALIWLADADEAQIGLEDDARLETRYALATIFYATRGDGWLENLGFLSAAHECDWTKDSVAPTSGQGGDTFPPGVSCNGEDEVIALNLGNNNLRGSIPEEIQGLSNLRHLNIASNKIQDDFPELDGPTTLRNVAQLDLVSFDGSNNAWEMTIPTELVTLTNLQVLRLGDNKFELSHSGQLSRLTNMKELYLAGNSAMAGNLEEVVENMSILQVLNADNCDFVVSSDLRFPTSLTILNVGGNNNPSDRNNPIFALSSNIGLLSNLQTLVLSDMQLTGVVPTEVGMMTNLQVLDLASNDFTGTFPWSNLNPATLRRLVLDRNTLEGELPLDLGRFIALQNLDMERNRFRGRIPESIGNLTALQSLDIGFNVFSGPLPTTLGNLASLVELRVPFNSLTGMLPSEMANMASLAFVEVRGNEFTGGDLDFICSKDEAEGKVSSSQNINCGCCEVT